MLDSALVELPMKQFHRFLVSTFPPVIKTEIRHPPLLGELVERVIYFIIHVSKLFLLIFIYALDNPFLLYSLPLSDFYWAHWECLQRQRRAYWVRGRRSDTTLCGFKPCPCHLLSGWPQADYLTSQSLLLHSSSVGADLTGCMSQGGLRTS